jgi:hypothetical protein
LIPLPRSWRTRQTPPARQSRSGHDGLVPELRQRVRGGAGKSSLQTQTARERRVPGERVRLTVGDEARLFDDGLRVYVKNAEEASVFGLEFRNGPHQIGPMLSKVERIRGASGKTKHSVMYARGLCSVGFRRFALVPTDPNGKRKKQGTASSWLSRRNRRPVRASLRPPQIVSLRKQR